MSLTHQTYEVDEPLAGRVDRVVQKITGLTRSQVNGLFDHGSVTVNGQPCAETFQRVLAGDTVAVHFDRHTRYHEKPKPWRDSTFRLVFEDEHLLVVDKAAWVQTVPSETRPERTLLDAVNNYLGRSGRGRKAFVVHRLDRGTSGLLVLAKSEVVSQRLKNQFEAHKPKREYLALVAGEVQGEEGTLRSYLRTAPNLTRYSTPAAEGAQLAVTHYVVEDVCAGMTLVRCRLETGRRNQIRVHFAERGHPVLGDPRYKPKLAKHPRWTAHRLALHAAILGFTHPLTGKALEFVSPMPFEFNKALGRRSPPLSPRERRV